MAEVINRNSVYVSIKHVWFPQDNIFPPKPFIPKQHFVTANV